MYTSCWLCVCLLACGGVRFLPCRPAQAALQGGRETLSVYRVIWNGLDGVKLLGCRAVGVGVGHAT